MSKFNDLRKSSFINKVQEYSEGKKKNLSERVTFTMEKEYIDILFKTTKTQGLGFGLPICKSIIEQHRGEFFLEVSQPGCTVFCFILPLAMKKC